MKHQIIHLRQSGFTLIELMIVVTIVAILTAIAFPSYVENVARGKRADGKVTLGQMQTWMERYYTENGRYDMNQFQQALDTTKLAYPSAPGNNLPDTYVLSISNLTATTYTLTATRAGAMASDKCGDFVLTHQNVKSVRNSAVPPADQMRTCWGR